MIMNGYKLIPMKDITDEARKLAVLWMECNDKNWIGQKHKLASDIMNYACKYHESKVKNLGLFSVSQQRELLINVMTMYCGDENSQLHPDIIKIIDTYLKIN